MEANDRLLGRAPRGQGQKHREGGRGRAWSSRPVQSSQVVLGTFDFLVYVLMLPRQGCALITPITLARVSISFARVHDNALYIRSVPQLPDS